MMARIMLASMAKRLQSKVQDIAMLSLQSATQRIVAYMLGAAGESGTVAATVELPALKQVLARHPGTTQIYLRLISGERITTLELDQGLRVTPSSALMGDLKALLGPGCLGG